ncbi:MAG: dUTP diphosphatase [Phycisphaerales bacterium]
MTLQFKRLPHGEGIDQPAYQSDHAAGMDLHAAIDGDATIAPGEIRLVPCGFAMAIAVGYEAQIRPRSGLAVKHGLSMPNTPGTIDADYRGEVKVPLINLGKQPVTITRNMRIAQMVIAPVMRATWQVVDELADTRRGEGGFGHTGH